MFIVVQLKNVYGNELIYPACNKAKSFAAIAGTKTLTRHDIDHIKALGFAVHVAPATL